MDTTQDRPARAPAPAELKLGIPGFDFVDLHRPERLADLQALFHERLAQRDPALSRRWNEHASGQQRVSEIG